MMSKLKKNDKRKRNKKLNRQQYKAELENQIKSNIQHQTQQHEIENIDILSSRNGVKIQAKNEFFDYPTQNEEIASQQTKKKKAMDIAQENISNYTARENIRKKNAVDEDLYLK